MGLRQTPSLPFSPDELYVIMEIESEPMGKDDPLSRPRIDKRGIAMILTGHIRPLGREYKNPVAYRLRLDDQRSVAQ